MNNSNIFILSLVANLEFLEGLGFEKEKLSKFGDGKRVQLWSRSRGWKLERVEIFYYDNNPKWCELSFVIYISVGSIIMELVTQNLGILLHKKRQYDFPQILKKIRSERIVRQICIDVETSIAWFDDMSSRHCLDLMEASDERIQITKSNRHYPQVVELLQKA